jgi:hypothetical protein
MKAFKRNINGSKTIHSGVLTEERGLNIPKILKKEIRNLWKILAELKS